MRKIGNSTGIVLKLNDTDYAAFNEDNDLISIYSNTLWDYAYMSIEDWFETDTASVHKECTCWSLLNGHLEGCSYDKRTS